MLLRYLMGTEHFKWEIINIIPLVSKIAREMVAISGIRSENE